MNNSVPLGLSKIAYTLSISVPPTLLWFPFPKGAAAVFLYFGTVVRFSAHAVGIKAAQVWDLLWFCFIKLDFSVRK